MAGFLGVGGGQPQVTTVPLDPGTSAIEGQQLNQAAQPSSYYTGMLNSNLGQATGGLGQGDQQLSQVSKQTGMSPGQLGAIRNVYNQHAAEGIGRITQQNQMQGQMMKADYLSKMSQAMLGQQVNAVNQYQVLTNAYQQQEMARAGAINSLFQVADTGIGMQMAQNRKTGAAALTPSNNPYVGGSSVGSANVGGGEPYGSVNDTGGGTMNSSGEGY